MKSTLLLALMAVFVAFAASNSFAADTCYTAPDTCWVCRTVTGDTITVLDVHACDTVRLGCPVSHDLIVGDSIALPVYLFNDEPLAGMSLGFIKDSSAVKFRRFVKNSAVIPPEWVWLVHMEDETPQSITLGGADFTSEAPIEPVEGNTAQLLGTIYLLIQSGAVPERISLDSSFVPPGGYWLLAPTFVNVDGVNPGFEPKYQHCSPDIIVGNWEPGVTHVIPGMACPDQSLWVYIIGQGTQFGQGSPTTTSVWFSQSSPTLAPIYSDMVDVISPTRLNAHFSIPSGAPFGLRDVSVQNQGDPSPVTRPNGFEIVPRPALVSVVPDSGRLGSALSVSITGVNTHFYQSSSSSVVWLSQGSSTIYSSSLSVHTSTLLDAWFSIPQQTPTGHWDVSVFDPVYGLPAATLPNGFTIYQPAACGDVDGSGRINLTDAVYLINYIFADDPPPLDVSKGDIDCSNQTDLADAVYMVNYIFGGGPAPCEGPSCPPK